MERDGGNPVRGGIDGPRPQTADKARNRKRLAENDESLASCVSKPCRIGHLLLVSSLICTVYILGLQAV